VFKKFFKRNDNVSEHPTSFEPLHEKAFLHSQALEKVHDKTWQTDKAERFDVDFKKKRIWWTFEDGTIIAAPATLLGTWSEESETFLWGWDHPMCPPADNEAAKTVLAYAEEHEIIQLKIRKVEVSKSDALQISTIGVLLGNLQGLFATPGSNGSYIFIGFGEVKAE